MRAHPERVQTSVITVKRMSRFHCLHHLHGAPPSTLTLLTNVSAHISACSCHHRIITVLIQSSNLTNAVKCNLEPSSERLPGNVVPDYPPPPPAVQRTKEKGLVIMPISQQKIRITLINWNAWFKGIQLIISKSIRTWTYDDGLILAICSIELPNCIRTLA